VTASTPNAEPVKVTVFLTRDAYTALERSADREGLTRTDAINRAVLAWDQLTGKPGRPFAYEADGGEGGNPTGGEPS
jgi:hypothetical protein